MTARNIYGTSYIFMRTIIVDGAASQRRILSLLLETESSVPAEAFDTPASAAPFSQDDRVFLDAAFPPDSVHPAAVITTGSVKQDELLAQRIREGAATFLVKPYTRETLLRALNEAALLTAIEGAPA